jgi:hypothetical protein
MNIQFVIMAEKFDKNLSCDLKDDCLIFCSCKQSLEKYFLVLEIPANKAGNFRFESITVAPSGV